MGLRLLKLRIAFGAVVWMLLRPAYAILAIGFFVLALTVILWAANLSLLAYVVGTNLLSLADKLSLLIGGFSAVITNYDAPAAASLLIFCALLGVNLSALIFVVRSRMSSGGAQAKSGLSAVAAAVGAGCAACGTSILTPALTTLGAGGVVGLSRTLGLIINLIGIGLVLWSLFGLGGQIATIRAGHAQR